MNTFTVVDGTLYQWDTGRKLKIKQENQINMGEVHFSTAYLAEALVVKPYVEGGELFVNIPNILLQKSCKITVYMVVLLENGEQTICGNTFCVIARKRPADYVYTESEVMTWTTLEAKIPQKLSDLEIDLEIGTNSATYTPFVSGAGELSWTNNKGLPNPEPVNVKGEKGDRGEQGIQGIPGEKGDKGEKGDVGAQGIQGIQGIPGVKGEKGEKGDTGAQGAKGDKGEKGIPGENGAPGDAPYIGENGNWFIGDTDTETSASGTPNAVQYVPQALTPDQQTQARRNIDAQSQVYAVKRANPWHAEDCVNAPIRGLKLYGASGQDGTPTPENPIEVKCNDLTYALYGRNLINISDIQEQTDTGLTIKYLPEEGCIMLNGTASSSKLRFRNILKIEIGVGTPITLSLSYISGETTVPEGKYSVFYVGESDTETAGNFIDVNLSKNNTSKTKYSTKRYVVDAWTYIEQGVTFSNYKFRIQAEIGNTVNPYTPYFYGSSITAPSLYGIGDVQDEWNAMTGRGVRKIGKIIIDGSANKVFKNDSSSGSYLYYYRYIDHVGGNNYTIKALCSHFKEKNSGPYKRGEFSAGDIVIIFCAEGLVSGDNAVLQNADEVNAFLASQSAAGTPVTVYYELVKPEPFETMSVGQITMPDGYAQFLPSGDGAAGDVEAEYAVDIEKRYTHKLVTEEILRMETNDICSFIKFDVKRDYKIIHVYLSTSTSNSVLVKLSDGTTPIDSTLTILRNKTSYSDALLNCVGGFNIISTKGIRYYTSLQYTDDKKYTIPKTNHIIGTITPNNDSAIYGSNSVDYGFNETSNIIVKAGDYLALVPKTGSVISNGVKVVIVGEYYE